MSDGVRSAESKSVFATGSRHCDLDHLSLYCRKVTGLSLHVLSLLFVSTLRRWYNTQVNCPFYFKIGACRHGDRCSRLHHKPAFSQTLLFRNLFQHPVRQAEIQQAAGATGRVNEEQALEDFLCFFEDLYMELGKFGRVEGIYVADNLGDHMIGHVYVKYFDEEEASDALQVMNGRLYDGRAIQAEFSPVTDFREARCRDYDEMACQRGGFCNFLHVKPVPFPLIRSLEEDSEADRRDAESKRRAEKDEDRRRKHEKKRKRRDDDKRDRDDDRRDRDDDRRKRRHHSRSQDDDRSRS